MALEPSAHDLQCFKTGLCRILVYSPPLTKETFEACGMPGSAELKQRASKRSQSLNFAHSASAVSRVVPVPDFGGNPTKYMSSMLGQPSTKMVLLKCQSTFVATATV